MFLKLDGLLGGSPAFKKQRKETQSIFNAEKLEIAKLLSVTKNDFEQLYVEVIDKVADYLADAEKTQEILTRIIAVLKVRRGFMLPIGADTETCYKQQDVWTYALFTALILKPFWKDSIEVEGLAKQWIPEKGISWLKKYSDLFASWSAFLTGKADERNNIARMVYLTEDLLAGKSIESYEKTPLESFEIINADTEIYEETPGINESAKPELINQFIDWIKRGITRKFLTVNTPESMIHRVNEGVLLTMPNLYQAFLKANTRIKANYYLFAEQINTDLGFLKNPHNNQFIYSYYWGDWNDRNVINGFLVAPETLLIGSSLPINTELHLEPI